MKTSIDDDAQAWMARDVSLFMKVEDDDMVGYVSWVLYQLYWPEIASLYLEHQR